ncbi:MAG: PDZ domain-containing protein [Dysgonamonadaceae bacterium]|jgi:carboxyl-terminal processing protease|nr:PDZ domain-containing protein [Dysgonamonadaceae bacterium]
MGAKKTTWQIATSIAVSLIIGILIGNFISGKSLGRSLFLTPNNKINVILDIINEDYVDPINLKEMTEGAIVNIINELDPHSNYIPGSELQTVNVDMEGHFGGIGASFFIHKDTIVITNLVYGGPSSQAGLLPGDRIIYVNDSLFTGPEITEDKILNTLRGPVGSTVKLGIQRDFSDAIITYRIKRNNILLTTVKAFYEVKKGIGFIKIYDKFSHSTYDEFMQAATKLIAQGCTSFILDLRMNSGGSFEVAGKIINEFLPADRMIVYAEGKSFPRIETISDGSGIFPENQLVVLIDQMSASASEIVAGAIQDNDRGLIIGRRSFGKGLVQNQIELSDGSAVRLTIARYYTPSGRNIQRKYQLGKSDEYNQEWINRINSGEGFYEDSVKIDKSLVYNTISGRPVYGNGGIMPDIFVPIDTTHLSTYYINLNNKDIFNKFAFEYSDKNRKILNTFKDHLSMLEYLKTQPVLYEIVRFAEENGVKKRTFMINRYSNQILLTTYACILSNFFGDEAFYQVYLSDDPVIAKAIEAIRKGDAFPQTIASMKYKELQ